MTQSSQVQALNRALPTRRGARRRSTHLGTCPAPAPIATPSPQTLIPFSLPESGRPGKGPCQIATTDARGILTRDGGRRQGIIAEGSPKRFCCLLVSMPRPRIHAHRPPRAVNLKRPEPSTQTRAAVRRRRPALKRSRRPTRHKPERGRTLKVGRQEAPSICAALTRP